MAVTNEAAAAEQPDDPYSDLPVGEILRRARLHYGQSLEQIERALRIRAIQLDAIEKGNIENLPGRVYAIGFVRSYAEYLGLDGDRMVYLFKLQSMGNQNRPELNFPAPASESKAPGLFIVAGGVIAAVLLLVIWSVFFIPKQPERGIAPVPEELKETTLTDAPAIGQPPGAPESRGLEDKEPESVPSPGPVPQNRVVIEVTANSWVEIKENGGGVVLRRILKPGDKYFVPDDGDFVLSTGNAGGLTVVVDGKPVKKLGKPAQVRRNIALDPDILLKYGVE